MEAATLFIASIILLSYAKGSPFYVSRDKAWLVPFFAFSFGILIPAGLSLIIGMWPTVILGLLLATVSLAAAWRHL